MLCYGVRPAEVHAWLCFMELLCFDMYPMSATGCMLLCEYVCMCVGGWGRGGISPLCPALRCSLVGLFGEMLVCVLLKQSPGLDGCMSMEQERPLVEKGGKHHHAVDLLMTPGVCGRQC